MWLRIFSLFNVKNGQTTLQLEPQILKSKAKLLFTLSTFHQDYFIRIQAKTSGAHDLYSFL